MNRLLYAKNRTSSIVVGEVAPLAALSRHQSRAAAWTDTIACQSCLADVRGPHEQIASLPERHFQTAGLPGLLCHLSRLISVAGLDSLRPGVP